VVSAIEMLDVRLELLLRYLIEVHEGTAEPDHEVLRLASGAMASAKRVKSGDGDAFGKEMNKELDDACATQFLGTITKAAADFEQFHGRFNLVNDKGGRRF
jgi:COP9 signalosome complex subunit 6